LLRKVFIKAIGLLIIFFLISLVLQDNGIFWGIVTGMLLGLINFSLLCYLVRSVLNTERKILRILCTVALTFKLLIIGLLMALFLMYTPAHWLGMVVSINFILLLIIMEGIRDSKYIWNKEANCFGTRT